jgi:hypothetical protein
VTQDGDAGCLLPGGHHLEVGCGAGVAWIPAPASWLVGARCASRDDAVHDFDRLWAIRHEGRYDHVSVAVLTTNAAGDREVEQHGSTTKHAAWGAPWRGSGGTGAGVMAIRGPVTPPASGR